MSIKRIIPCLDVKDGKVVKGVNFQGVKEIASPVELGRLYSENGADELVFYDITASVEGRGLFLEVLKEVISQISVPLTVGGGINTLEDIDRVLKCGANKVSINSGAIRDPELIAKAAERFGSQCVVLSADIKKVDGRYMLFTRGGQENTGIDAIEWVSKAAENGAGQIVVNSIDTDGVKGGFDLEMLSAVCDAVSIPVIASGGAGSIEDFVELFKKVPAVDAGLAASVFHFGEVRIPELKKELSKNGIDVRL
ncbi:MAG: imidazole glycerol phosphate synthase subunit HisF [Clostridiales bacterium]|nr:imidazole glycerol phosphate synthase subunit HisF [Clostridiales bacterium]